MSTSNVKKVKSSEIELKDKLVAVRRVTKVTKGGRHFSFSAIVVVGNEKGVVGHGLGKANEVTDAIAKGIDDAQRNKMLIKATLVNLEELVQETRIQNPRTKFAIDADKRIRFKWLNDCMEVMRKKKATAFNLVTDKKQGM